MEKRKPILITNRTRKYWGSYTCVCCNKKVNSKFADRHKKSALHNKNKEKYEKANHCLIIEDIDKITVDNLLTKIKTVRNRKDEDCSKTIHEMLKDGISKEDITKHYSKKI